MEQFAGIKVDEFAVFALKVRHSDVRKTFQTGTKAAFRTPRAAGDASQLAEIACQKTDDEVPFLEWPGLQYEGFAHTSGHWKFKGNTGQKQCCSGGVLPG